jgi:iron complex outermembrane receptor protein
VNQNISMRGIYGVEFVMFMEDGMPVFPTMHTFFMNADNLFRMDENVERIEVVRGGNSALFGSNTPGAIVNIINRTGGPDISGTLKVTSGFPGGLGRYDFNVNGPFADRWRFNVGGFYRYDGGVRDPGFPGIRGGQLKANVTRLLDNGYVRVSTKIIDDRNQFILPLPFRNPNDPEYVPGFSNYGAMNTAEGLNLRIPLPFDNGELELPLADGIRTRAVWLTGDARFDFEGGWTLQNTAQLMQNDQSWNAILPFDVMEADAWASDRLQGLIGAGIVEPGSTYRLLFTNRFDATGRKLPFNTPNGLVAPGGQWHVEKPMSAFHDQLLVTKTVERHRFTGGAYFAYYTMDNRWFFTEILTDVRDNPRFLDMIAIEPDGDTVEVTKNGFRRFLANYANGTGHTTIASVFGSTELQVTDRLRLDLAGRYEYNNFVQASENNTEVDLDGDPRTPYDVEVWGNRTFRHFDFTFNEWALSGGFNYRVTDEIAVYGQGSRGFKTPALDEYLFPAEAQAALFKARHTLLFEGGVKYAGERFGATVNGFWGELRDVIGQGAETDPATGATVWVILTCEDDPGLCNTRSWGAEVELSGRPTPELGVFTNWTFLKAEFGQGADIGSWVTGVPPVIGNAAVTYDVQGFRLAADWHLVGRRWVVVDQNKLPTYTYLNLGASYRIPGQGIAISADLLNVYQSKGLEEGNPRLRQVGGRTSDLFLARPILPRRFQVSVKYSF